MNNPEIINKVSLLSPLFILTRNAWVSVDDRVCCQHYMTCEHG